MNWNLNKGSMPYINIIIILTLLHMIFIYMFTISLAGLYAILYIISLILNRIIGSFLLFYKYSGKYCILF